MWNDLGDPVFDGVGLAGFKSKPNAFYWPSCSLPFCILLFSISLLSFFLLPVLEYCSAVWCLAADTHLKLLDSAVSGARFLTGVCLSVTLHIVYPLEYCVCFIRLGVTRCTLLIVLDLDLCASAGYSRCSGCTSVHLCAASLQNLSVPHDFYFPFSVPLERSF